MHTKEINMKIESISFYPKHRNSSEIMISWESGETTSIFFISQYPLQVKAAYEKAIYSLFEQKKDIGSFNELFGLFSWWFARCNLIMPSMVVTFNNEERKRIGAKIKAIRIEQNIEARQLSLLTGIDAANLSRIEQGKTSVGVDNLSKIANALGYKIDLVKQKSINMQDLQIKFGKHSDSFEYLKSLTEEKAKEISNSLIIENGNKKSVTFWTADIPELIAVVNYEKNQNGDVSYTIDYSQTTL